MRTTADDMRLSAHLLAGQCVDDDGWMDQATEENLRAVRAYCDILLAGSRKSRWDVAADVCARVAREMEGK